MLFFAPCPPVPQHAVPSGANATAWSSGVSCQRLNQGVTHAACPVHGALWLRVGAEEVCSCVAF